MASLLRCVVLLFASCHTIVTALPNGETLSVRDNVAAVPVRAHAGSAYGPPSTPTTPSNNGGDFRIGGPAEVSVRTTDKPDAGLIQNPAYEARDIDLPFLRNFKGAARFYRHTNDPENQSSSWGAKHDNENQTACGIPTNAYWLSGVAIHPYFLKYAGLDRYCMQDVCVSFWRGDGIFTDMMLKVNDICPTDPSDSTSCQSPMDIKVDRDKVRTLFNLEGAPSGTAFDQDVYWMFTKCWADGMVQDAYKENNWFAQPEYYNSVDFSLAVSATQYFNNQKNYPGVGFQTHSIGQQDHFNVDPLDWSPGDPEPGWTPFAGGTMGDQIGS